MKKTSARLSESQAHAGNANDGVSKATRAEASVETGLQPIVSSEPFDLDDERGDFFECSFDWSQLDEMQHHWWRPL